MIELIVTAGELIRRCLEYTDIPLSVDMEKGVSIVINPSIGSTECFR